MGISGKDNYLKSNIINNMIVIPGYSIPVLFFFCREYSDYQLLGRLMMMMMMLMLLLLMMMMMMMMMMRYNEIIYTIHDS